MLLLTPALAAPTFLAEPEIAALASASWRAATACAGREAPAHREVRVTVGVVAGGFNGRAHSDLARRTVWRDGQGAVLRTETSGEEGLYWIELDRPLPRTIAHEVAHAWVNGGPPALVEGATDLLADCIAERLPDRVPRFRPSASDPSILVDLRTWTNSDEAGDERTVAYDASARLMRVVAELVPREQLWRSGWTWDEFDRLLVGPRGDAVADMLAAGAEAQRRMLRDIDGDGLDGLTELAAGLDPDRIDSDGDGWNDGVEVPLGEGTLRLPVDGTLLCSGLAAGILGARFEVEAPLPDGSPGEVGVWSGSRYLWAHPRRARPGESILVARTAGVGTARLRGRGLVPDGRCRSGRFSTVIGAAPPAFVAAVERLAAEVDTNLGLRRRVVLWVGRLPEGHVSAVVVPMEIAGRVREDPEYAAALAVAYARVRQSERREDMALVEAFARSLVSRDGAPWVTPRFALVEPWTETAAEIGWREVLDGER